MKTASIILISIVLMTLISWLNKANADKNKNNSVNSDLDKENKKLTKAVKDHLSKNKMILTKDNKNASKAVTKPPNFKLSPQLVAAKKKCWNYEFFNHSKKSIETRECSKIVNGTDVCRRGALPWMVVLFVKFNNDIRYICGGSLISAKFVLTAAHCIGIKKKWKPKMIIVRYGMHDLSSKTFIEQEIVSVTAHPDFNLKPGVINSDIAIIKLKGSAKYSSLVNPICIPFLTTPSYWDLSVKGTLVLVSGWGDTSSNYSLKTHEILQKGYANLVNHTECLKVFGPGVYNTTTMLCLGKRAEAAAVCSGDSGSPLVPVISLKKPHNIILPVVLGVNSFGTRYCTGPTAITKVESFIEWINDQTTK